MKKQIQPRVILVIPAYQAERTIRQVLGGFCPLVDEVVVVDDGSTDETNRQVRESGHANLALLEHGKNQGVGAAVKTGIREALARGADIVVKADADGQMQPRHLNSLLAPLLIAAADCCKGNRWQDRAALRRMPRRRRWGNLALGFLLKLASGFWKVFDPTNGYLAWRAELLHRIDFSRVSDRYLFECSMLVEVSASGGTVRDVPIPACFADETSNLRISRFLVQFPFFWIRATLRRIWQTYFVSDFNAVSLLLVAGISLGTFSACFGGYHWYQSIRSGTPATAGTVFIAALPLLFGCNCLLQALVLDVAGSRRKPISRTRYSRSERQGQGGD